MGRKMPKIVLAALAALAAALLAVGADTSPRATTREAAIEGAPVGEVLLDHTVVISIRTSAGGLTQWDRAGVVAARINRALDNGMRWEDLRVATQDGETALLGGSVLLATADAAEATAADTTPDDLALGWRDNLISALGGEPNPPPETGKHSDSDPKDNQEAGYPDWEAKGSKFVPVLSAGTPGVSIGAARVVGPKEQVDRVKAVAQLEASFKGLARIYVYVPVSSLNVIKLDRVQGVSVQALGDVRILGF